MIERLALDAGIDRRRIFITGLSAGGAMAVAMLATYPEDLRGRRHSLGPALPDRRHGPEKRSTACSRDTGAPHGNGAISCGRPRLIEGPWPSVSIWHGMADTTVVPSNADELAKQWLDVHGLDDSSARSEISGRLVRQTWHGPDGKPVIEKCLIAGMGHGAPIDARGGAPGKGNVGPFMLDVGILVHLPVCAFLGPHRADRPNRLAVEARTSRGRAGAAAEPVRGRRCDNQGSEGGGPDEVTDAGAVNRRAPGT